MAPLLIANKATGKIHVRISGGDSTICNLDVTNDTYRSVTDSPENRRKITCNGCGIVNNGFFGEVVKEA